MPHAATPTNAGRVGRFKTHALAIRLIAPVVTLGVASLLLIAYLLWAAHGVALRHAETETLNYAQVLETRIDGTMRRVEGVLAEIARAVPAQAFEPDAQRQFPQINASLDALVTNFPEAQASRLIDTNGQLRYSSGVQPSTPINVLDRDWFKQALAAPAGSTVISQTIIGRASQEPVVVVARALRHENGKVYGIATVALALNVFQKQFEALNIGEEGAIALRRADNHTLLLRWPHLPDEVNQPFKATHPMVQGVQAGLGPFNVQITAQTDGKQRIYGVDHRQGNPFYLIVGITRESALAPWRQQAITIGVLSVLLLTVVLFALWRLWVNETRRLLVQSALSASEAQLRNLMQSLSVGIVVHGPDTQVLQYNKTALALLGSSGEQIMGKMDLDPAWCFVREDGTPMPVVEYPVTRVSATFEPVHDLVLGILRPRTNDCAWVLVNAFPEFASNDQIQQVVVTFVDITENKKAAIKLAAQEHYLSSLINNIGDPVFVKDEHSRFVLANDAFCSFFGFPRSRILGKTMAEALPAQQMDHFLRVDRQVMGDGHESLNEEFFTVPGGATLTVQTRKTRYTDESGNKFLIGVTRDITERKQAEATRARLFHILESSLNEVYVFDAESLRFTYVNQGALRNLGYSLEAMQGMTPVDLKPEFTDASFRHVIASLIRHEKAQHGFETVHRRADGSLYPVDVHLQLVEHKNERVFLAIILDITQRKAADAAARDSNQRLNEVIWGTNIATWEWNVQTGATVFNERWAEIVGYTLEELAPISIETWGKLVHPDDAKLSGDLLARCFSRELDTYDCDARMRHKEGHWVWVNDRGRVVEWAADGKPLRMAGTHQDITKRKQAEAALIAAHHKTAAINQDLSRSNADLEQFAYVASHDLIEPLRSVASSVQLLQKRYAGQLDARADEFIAHAVSGAMRMQTLIDDLLTFSRVAAKKSQTEEVSMDHALREAVRNLEEAIGESNAKITHDVLPRVHGHGTQIIQLLQNLIANAIKFRGKKAPVVHVGARQEGAEWVFSVADLGIGIAPQHFARVFELFKRLHTREEYPGTGIGLALCKKIVERHGGRIWVESQLGEGTCFYFTLPVQSLSNT